MLGGSGSCGHSDEVQVIHRPPPGRVVYTLLDGPEIPKTRSESGRVCIITDKARVSLVGGETGILFIITRLMITRDLKKDLLKG